MHCVAACEHVANLVLEKKHVDQQVLLLNQFCACVSACGRPHHSNEHTLYPFHCYPSPL